MMRDSMNGGLAADRSPLTTMRPVACDYSSDSNAGQVDETTRTTSWHVLHTRARQEKAVARALLAAGIEHYLPLIRRVTFYGRSRRVVQVPLFASYMFLKGNQEDVYFAMSTRRVSNVINVTNQSRLIHELNQICCALEGGAELSPYRYLKVGRHVRVTAGPFRGLEGMIEELEKRDRIVLQIAALGRATSLEIDASLLELVA